MGTPATKAKNKYNSEKYDRIALSVPKGNKDKYKALATSKGFKSLNDFIISAIENYK